MTFFFFKIVYLGTDKKRGKFERAVFLNNKLHIENLSFFDRFF